MLNFSTVSLLLFEYCEPYGTIFLIPLFRSLNKSLAVHEVTFKMYYLMEKDCVSNLKLCISEKGDFSKQLHKCLV